MSHLLPDFNSLVLEAADAQQAFDDWDEGATWDPRSPKLGKRVCTLDQVCEEWDEANRKLIDFVLANGEQLKKEMEEKG